MELAESLHLIDYPRGAKLGGSGKWVYTGDGAVLEWALINYFIETHRKDGWQFMLVPHLLNYEAGFCAGPFPKFEEDVFWAGDREGKNDQFLLPTAETALVNLHRGEILSEDELPKKYFAYTPCYRREAGSYRSEERGMIRGNQFNKVEMVQYTVPEKSDEAFAEMVEKAEGACARPGAALSAVQAGQRAIAPHRWRARMTSKYGFPAWASTKKCPPPPTPANTRRDAAASA